jgi:hypothetical protein
MKSFSRWIQLTAILGTLIALPLFGHAQQYFVSYRGEFSIQYPDDWKQVEYNVVDAYLAARQVDASAFRYEAVLASADADPFYTGAYVIVTVDTRGGAMSDSQIDSTLNTLARQFGKGIKYSPVGDLLTNVQSETPGYDRAEKMVSIPNRITDRGEAFKRNLVIMKFYDKGIASFYCYAPDSVFDQHVDDFRSIATSLETENYRDKAPREEVRVADVDTEGGGLGVIFWLLIAIAGMLILVVVWRVLK